MTVRERQLEVVDRLSYDLSMARRAKVLTVSDRVSTGERVDEGGPAVASRLSEAGFDVVETRVVADGIEPVVTALREMSSGFAGLIVTTGGTGFSPRDLTPEATIQVLEREAPGFGEVMRTTHPFGPLSRSRCGTVGQCVIINTPGSPSGAVESIDALIEMLPHAVDVLIGPSEHHPPETGGSTATSS
jgi:molybdopterin adenylyltransferase